MTKRDAADRAAPGASDNKGRLLRCVMQHSTAGPLRRGRFVTQSVTAHHAADHFWGKPAPRKKPALAYALCRLGRRLAEAPKPHGVRPREFGIPQGLNGLTGDVVRQAVLRQLGLNPCRAKARSLAVDNRISKALGRQKAQRLQFVEQGVDLLGRLGMGAQFAAQLHPGMLARRQIFEGAPFQGQLGHASKPSSTSLVGVGRRATAHNSRQQGDTK